MAAKIPVTVITGFLGAGKTTLLDHILHDTTHKKRIAVIENEYGAPIGVKNEMRGDVGQAVFVAEIVETTSGCLCCAGRGNFINVLERLVENRDKFDYIIVETDGLSDPTFARAFFQEPSLAANLQLDGIVTLVDAKHITAQLDKPKENSTLNEALEQIAVADRILLNKTDLVDEKTLSGVKQRLQSINPTAELLTAQYAKVDLSNVLDVKAFSLDRIKIRDPDNHAYDVAAFLQHRPERQHDADIGSVSLQLTEPVQGDRFKKWLEGAVQRHNFLRLKGVISVAGDEHRHCFQGVSKLYVLGPQKLWGNEPKVSRMVFIARDLDKHDLMESFAKEVGVKAHEPGAHSRGSIPLLNTMILFAVTLLMFCPDEDCLFSTYGSSYNTSGSHNAFISPQN